jgi:hypothetical protein
VCRFKVCVRVSERIFTVFVDIRFISLSVFVDEKNGEDKNGSVFLVFLIFEYICFLIMLVSDFFVNRTYAFPCYIYIFVFFCIVLLVRKLRGAFSVS